MPIPHIVIDTNVMVAGLRSRRGSAFRLLTLVDTARFTIHLSVPLVFEYEEVLLRQLPHFQVPRSVAEDVLDLHCTVATRHQILFLWRPYLPDPDDDMLLELAVTAHCDFMVTYNTRDFVGVERFALRVIEPGAFLRHIGAFVCVLYRCIFPILSSISYKPWPNATASPLTSLSPRRWRRRWPRC